MDSHLTYFNPGNGDFPPASPEISPKPEAKRSKSAAGRQKSIGYYLNQAFEMGFGHVGLWMTENFEAHFGALIIRTTYIAIWPRMELGEKIYEQHSAQNPRP